MRLWSFHPKYLDPHGLVALWREALLARAVLRGQTRGYRHHPQLNRFLSSDAPRRAISAYLDALHCEAVARGYAFDRSKVGRVTSAPLIVVPQGQLDYEWEHLLRKLALRSPGHYRKLRSVRTPAPHPSFEIVLGGIAPWERLGPEQHVPSRQPPRRARRLAG